MFNPDVLTKHGSLFKRFSDKGRMMESSVTLWAIVTFACNDAFIRFAQSHDISPNQSGVVDHPCTDVNHPEEFRHC